MKKFLLVSGLLLWGLLSRSQTYVQVNSNQPPLLLADAGIDRTICSGDSVTIGGTPAGMGGTPSYSYSWSSTGPMTSNTSDNPKAFPGATTTYYLTVTDARGCTATDTAVVSVDTCVGIPDTRFPFAFSIFPNPSLGDFKILLEGNSTSDELTGCVKDMTGRTVETFSFGKISGRTEKEFSLQGIAKGTYLIELSTREGKAVRRLTIQ